MIHIPGERAPLRARAWPGNAGRPQSHPLSQSNELIVNFCPTGMVPTRATTPQVPTTPAEVIDEACRGLERGAAIVHLYARDRHGNPTYRAEIYETMILGIRGHFPDAVVCVSCSGADTAAFERRSEVLELTGSARPDMARLTLAPLEFPAAGADTAELVVALGEKMAAQGIKPELECFDFGMISAANTLIRNGLLGTAPYYFNLVPGSRYSVAACGRHLSNMLEDLPRESVWSAAGIGPFQLPINTLALALGGHCRVGLEENIYQGFNGLELATNLVLLERLAQVAEIFGRPLATCRQARELLGLRPPVSGQLTEFDYDEESGQPTHV